MAFKAASDHNRGTSKKSTGRRRHGLGRAYTRRADRITKHNGVGVGYNIYSKGKHNPHRQHGNPCRKDDLGWDWLKINRPGAGIYIKQSYDWDTALAAEAKRRAEVWARRTIRRTANRDNFTLAKVIAMITALRTGTVRKAGGKGFNCQTPTAVTQQGDYTMSTNNQKVSRRINQMLARNNRVRRQRRNGRRYIKPISSAARAAHRKLVTAKVERRTARRRALIIERSLRLEGKGVVTKALKAFRASLIPKPITAAMRSEAARHNKHIERPILAGQVRKTKTAIDYRRLYAQDGNYHRRRDHAAAARAVSHGWFDPLNQYGQRSTWEDSKADWELWDEAQAKAAIVMAETKAKYAAAEGMVMMLQQNKAIQTGNSQETTMTVDHSPIFNFVTASGGVPVCYMQMDKTQPCDGTIVAGLVYVNASEHKVIRNLFPKDDFVKMEDALAFYKPEPTPGKSYTCGLGFIPDEAADATKLRMGQVTMHTIRVFGSVCREINGVPQVLVGDWTNAAYVTKKLMALDETNQYVPVGAADIHFVFNLPGRQPRKSEGLPPAEISTPRQYVRDLIYGNAVEESFFVDEFLYNHPNFSFTSGSNATTISQCIASHEGFYFNGVDTGIHVALVIGHVAKTTSGHDDIEMWKVGGADNFGQARVYLDKMAVVYLPIKTVFKVFQPTADFGKFNLLNTGMWPLFPQAKHAGVTVDTRTLCEVVAKVGINNRWNTYNQYCGKCMTLKGISIGNAPYTAPQQKVPVAETLAAKPETPVAQASIELPPVNDDSIAKELAAYDAAQKAARVGLPVKDVDYKAFMRSRAYLTKIQDVKLEHFGNGYAHAALIVAALAGEMASVLSGGRVRCKGYHWEKRHLVTLIDALKYAHAAGLVEQVDGSTTSIRNYFEVKDLPNDEFELWMDGKTTFRFLSNRVVVDIERGRIFHHTLELAYPDKNGDNLQYYIADSFSNFMHYFINGMMQLMGAYFDGVLPANYRSNCMKFLSNMASIKLSKDNWHEENGAARLMMENSYVPIIGCVTPFLASDGKHNALGAGAASLAKIHNHYEKLNKVKQEGKKDKVVSLNEMNTLAMRGIKGKYYLESHFTKASYLPFGAVHVELLKAKCPTLLAHAEKFLGYDFTHNKTAAVIIMTLKATKGLKRVTLAMAQAARPVKPAGAGFVLRNQNVRTVGTAVNVLLAPSLVCPPGQNPWVGLEVDMPAAYVSKTERNYMINSFKLDENGNPFDFTYSDLPTFVDNEWVLEDRGDSYTYVVPKHEAIIEGNKPLMFTVLTDDALAYEVNDVRHERDYNAKLDWIRFRVDQSVTRDDANLVIEYQATWVEHYGKIRSFNKAQIIRCNPILVRNRLNPSLEGIKFDMVCTQDALKLDVLYSMLMLIGNSVNANYRNGNKSAKMTTMFNEIRRINKLLGWDTDESNPILVIDEVAVVSGLYKNLLDYFEANFVHPEGIWFDFRGDAVQARIVYNIYRNKAEAGKDWEKVPNPLASKLGTYLVLEEGETVVAYKEVGKLSHKTNILVFILDKDGMPTGYLQRTYVICGDVDAPLVNVELYESSTVQESVSTSNIDLPTIVAMEHCISDKALAIKVQKELLNGGRQSMLRFKALAYADQNISVIDNLTPIHIQQVGDTLAISDEDRAKLWAALNQGGITKEQIAIRGTHCFKQTCLKLANYEFVLPKSLVKATSYDDFGDYGPDFGEDCAPVTSSSPYYRIWMPVLYSFSGLTSRNENNQSFEAIFYKDILKMLLQGNAPQAILAQRCYYVMRSLLNSEDMLKLPMGKQNVTAKRVALGDIRVGEIHIVKSNNPKSPYQKARRQGMEAGSIIHGSRKPLAIGYLAELVIRHNVEYRDGEGNLICIKQFIHRKGEQPVEARYFLSDVQIGCDVFMPTAYDRGDFDGDGFYITLIDSEGVVANTWDDGVAILHAASQLHPFAAKNGSYFCDHYGIKTYAKAMKTMGSGIVTAITDEEKGVILDLDVHAANNANAIKVQHGAVGVAYAVYQIGMTMTNLMSYVGSHFADAKYYSDALLRVFMRDNIKHLVGLAAEMYEVMLGGFDKGPDAYRDILDSIVKGERFYSVHMPNPNGDESITKYNEKIDANHKMVEYVMDLLGTKVDAHKEVAVIIELTSIYYQIKKGYNIELQQGENNTCTIKADSARNWVALAAFIFEMGRSEFTGFRGVGRPNLANYYSDDKTSEEIKAEAFQKCADLSFAFAKAFAQHSDNIYIYALVDIEKTLGSVISCTPEQIQAVRWDHSDCMTFINACKGEDVIETVATEVVTVEDSDDLDDSDDDGGSVVANDDNPNQPNDNNGGECTESQAKYEDTEILMEVSKGEYYVDSEVKELAYALDFKVKFSLRDLNQFNGFLRQKGLSPIHRVESVNDDFLTNILDHDISVKYMESSNGLKTSYDQLIEQVNQLKEDNLPIFFSFDTRCWAMIYYLLKEDCGFNNELDCRYYWKPSKENQTTDNGGEAIIEQTEMIEENVGSSADVVEAPAESSGAVDQTSAGYTFPINPKVIKSDLTMCSDDEYSNLRVVNGKTYYPQCGFGYLYEKFDEKGLRLWATDEESVGWVREDVTAVEYIKAFGMDEYWDTSKFTVFVGQCIDKTTFVNSTQEYVASSGADNEAVVYLESVHWEYADLIQQVDLDRSVTYEIAGIKFTKTVVDGYTNNDRFYLFTDYTDTNIIFLEDKDGSIFDIPDIESWELETADVLYFAGKVITIDEQNSIKSDESVAEPTVAETTEQDIVEDNYCPDFDDDFSDNDSSSPVEFEETDLDDLIEITSSDAAQAAQSVIPSDAELAQISEFLRQQLSVHGEQLTVQELLISLNDKQQNKANKLDDIVAESVPEMKEIVYAAVDTIETVESVPAPVAGSAPTSKAPGAVLVSEPGLFAQQAALYSFGQSTYDQLKEQVIETYNKGYQSKLSANGYSYTCCGDYYWIWKVGKGGQYLTTQPDGSAITAMPELLNTLAKEAVRKVLALYPDNTKYQRLIAEYEPQVALINKYDGGHKLKLHADKDEQDLEAPIVSFSFGASGVFNIGSKDLQLDDGAICLFWGEQRLALHGYKGNTEPGTRYNVTVRMVKKSTLVKSEDKNYGAAKLDTVETVAAPIVGNEVKQEANNVTGLEPVLNWDMQNSIVFSTQTATHKTLSNLLGAPCIYNGVTYKSAEGAYQAAKELNTSPETAARFAAYDGFEAKKQGYSVKLRADWDAVKNDIMKKVLLGKFSYEPAKTELLATGSKQLVHHAPWEARNGKTSYWGVDDNGYGCNWMGVLLMEVRSELQRATPAQAAAISQAQIDKVEALMSKLTNEQKKVVSTVSRDIRNTFLTGEGGAGKSFTVDIIRKCYDILGYPYLIVGSTGTSVVNIDGHNTFNGMFGLGRGFDSLKCNKGKIKEKNQKVVTRTLVEWEELRKNCRGSKQLMNRLPELKAKMERHQRPLLIIVDEISQCDSLLLSAVEDGLNARSINHHWLLVGDPMQFEPVNGYLFFKDVEVINKDGSKVLKQSPYNIKELNFIGFNLKDNMRAKGDKEWTDALRKIRMHQIVDDVPEVVKQRWEYSEVNAAPADALVIAPTNKTVNRFNKIATDKLLKARARNKTYFGTVATKVVVAGKPADHWLWKNAQYRITIFDPIKYEITLCEGMRVMLRSTNMKTKSGDMKVNNGQTGTIRYLGDNYVKVAFDNGVIEDVKPIEMEDPSGYGTFTQIPLVPAYAITINKSQGMTFDIPVVFHMYNEKPDGTIIPVIGENAFYVALSRLTTSKNCWFETGMKGIDPKSKQELTPYNVMIKSYKTNIEARNFTLDLK